MTDEHILEPFGGIDSNITDDAARGVPTAYRASLNNPQGVWQDRKTFLSFRECLTDLREFYGVEARSAYYYDDVAEEYIKVPNRVVLTNPAWIGSEGRQAAPQYSAAWTTASDSHSTNDAMDHFGPLVAAARETGNESCFGAVRGYRNGGDVAIDLFFREQTAGTDANPTRYLMGFECGYDYFKRRAVWAGVIAYDTQTGAVLRGLSEQFGSPTRGDVQDRLGNWYLDMFDRLSKVGDALVEAVVDARAYEIDLSNLPLTVQDVYEALGFPVGLSSTAAEQVTNAGRPTAWDLYEPITEAITAEYDGKVGNKSLVEHASTANELLHSPARSEQAAYEAAAQTLDGQGTVMGDVDDDAADVLRDRAASLDEAVETTLSFRERVRTMLNETEAESESEAESEADEPDADEDGEGEVVDA